MAIEKTINIKLNASEAISDLKKVRGEIDITYAELRRTTPIELDSGQATKELKKVANETKITAQGTKEIGKNAEGSVGGFKKLKISAQAFGAALKATGIGLLIGLLVKLQDALSQNQAVMDTFNVVTEKISITFQNLINGLVKTVQEVGKFFSKVGKVIKKFASQDLDGLTSSYEKNNTASDKAIENTKSLARQMVELRNEVKLAEANQRLLQLTYQRDAELQRQIRDDVSLTMKERIEANQELGRILDEQFLEEQIIAQKKIDLAEMELSKNKDNIDLQVALINAKTEMADLDERITGQRSEQLVNLTSLQREQAEDNKKLGEQEKTLSLEKLGNQQKELDNLDEIMKRRKKVATETSNFEIKTEQLTADAKRQIVMTSLNQVASALGESSKTGKALAIATTLIDTYQGATKALAQGGLFGTIGAAGIVAAGLANVAKIKATKLPFGDDSGGLDASDQPSVPQGLSASLIPNLESIQNVAVGETQPVQAFVVENDISNAQALQEELDIQATL
jgi:hypothetical protein